MAATTGKSMKLPEYLYASICIMPVSASAVAPSFSSTSTTNVTKNSTKGTALIRRMRRQLLVNDGSDTLFIIYRQPKQRARKNTASPSNKPGTVAIASRPCQGFAQLLTTGIRLLAMASRETVKSAP